MKKKIIFGIIIAMAAIGIVVGVFYKYIEEKIVEGVFYYNYFQGKKEQDTTLEQAKDYVVKYLDLRYKRDFVIKDGYYIYNTGGYEFTVYPKDDPGFTFHAWLNGMTESGVSDLYLIMQEKDEGKKMVMPYLDKISKDYFISAISVSPYTPLPDIDSLLSDMYDNQRSISYMLKKYPNKMRIALRTHINYNITPKNENDLIKKVYNLLEFLRQKKFGYIEMDLFFFDLKNNNKLEKDSRFNSDHANYRINFSLKETPAINSYKDIKKYLLIKKKHFNKGEYGWEPMQ